MLVINYSVNDFSDFLKAKKWINVLDHVLHIKKDGMKILQEYQDNKLVKDSVVEMFFIKDDAMYVGHFKVEASSSSKNETTIRYIKEIEKDTLLLYQSIEFK